MASWMAIWENCEGYVSGDTAHEENSALLLLPGRVDVGPAGRPSARPDKNRVKGVKGIIPGIYVKDDFSGLGEKRAH